MVGVGDEVVGGHAEHGHDGCTGNGTQNGGLAALVALVDKGSHWLSGQFVRAARWHMTWIQV